MQQAENHKIIEVYWCAQLYQAIPCTEYTAKNTLILLLSIESLFISVFFNFIKLIKCCVLFYKNLMSCLWCVYYLICFMMNMRCFVVVTTSRVAQYFTVALTMTAITLFGHTH